MRSLVLFPGGRVLLPRQRLHMRVHDTRLSNLLAGQGEVCAVFSPRRDELSPVGVLARITAHTAAPDDRLDVELLGSARLRLGERTSDGMVEVEELAEAPGDGDLQLLRDELQRGVQRFAAAAVESGRPASISSVLHADPTVASYQAATLMPISHPERQELLEIETTTARLEQGLRIVHGETGILRHVLGLGRIGA